MQGNEQQINISVAMPTSGRVDLFKITLESLAQQTYKNFELVISDDSPKEEDRRLIKQAAEAFVKRTGIKTKYVFTQPKLYQARNTSQAIQNASFEYVHLLHSDDVLAPQCLAAEAWLLSQNPDVDFIYNDAKAFYDDFIPNMPSSYSYIDPFMYLKTYIHLYPPMPSGWCFKKDLYFDIGEFLPDFKYVCDWEFFYRILKYFISENKHFIRINKGYVGWRQHKDTVSGTLWLTFHNELFIHMNQMYKRELLDKYVDGVFLSNLFYQMKKSGLTKLWNDFGKKFPQSLLKIPEVFKILKDKKRFFNKVLKAKKRNKYDHLFNHPIFIFFNKQSRIKTFKLQASTFGDKHNRSVLELNPFYTESGSIYNDICLNFNNTMNLSLYESVWNQYNNIRIINPNVNRFYVKTLNEILKHLRVGQCVEFAFLDNEILTGEDLVKFVSDKSNGRLKLISSNKNDFNYNLISFDCVKNAPNYYSAAPTGFSFALFDNKSEEGTKRFIESVEKVLPNTPYEILMLKNDFAEKFKDCKNVKILEKADFKNTSEKKNYLCECAAYSDIVICNDEFVLTSDFKKYKFDYGVASTKLVNEEGERVLDWTFEDDNDLKPLNYREYSSYTALNPDIVLIRKEFFNDHKWNETVDDIKNVDFSKKIRQNGVVIELLDLTLVYAGMDLKPVKKELIYNSEYEIIKNKYVCGQKIYELEKNKLTQNELV